jgi:malonate transporter
MAVWLDAFVPTFGMLLLGALLKRVLLRDDAVWAGIEKLIFWLLLPALLVAAIGSVQLAALPLGGMAATIWGALLIGTALSLLLVRGLGHGHAAMTSVLQGGIRYNNLMGFAIGGALWGPPGIAMAGVATGFIVPCVQVVITIAFAAGGGRRIRPWPLLRQILLNPLFAACMIGFAVAALGGPPPGIGTLLRTLGAASVALGLLTVGAALSPATLAERLPTQALTGVLKLLVVPAVTFALARLCGLDSLATGIAVLLMALPTAATSYVMARALGGDAPLMAAITTTEHLASVLTLPLWAMLLLAVA